MGFHPDFQTPGDVREERDSLQSGVERLTAELQVSQGNYRALLEGYVQVVAEKNRLMATLETALVPCPECGFPNGNCVGTCPKCHGRGYVPFKEKG